MTTVMEVTATQIEAAKEAAYLRYTDGLAKQDRPGWTGGKCPVSEYYGIMAELGAANYLGVPTEDVCLYSKDSGDYKKADFGVWDAKAGSKWTVGDVRKGVRYVLWTAPVVLMDEFECGITTCGHGKHNRLDTHVLIRGWSNTKDSANYVRMGNLFYPKPMQPLDTIPWKTPVAA